MFDANVKYVFEDNTVNLCAERDISPGMELFSDYGTDYFKHHKHGALSKVEVLQKFSSKLDENILGWNLRFNSVKNPELVGWVIKAKKLVAMKRKTTNKDRREKWKAKQK